MYYDVCRKVLLLDRTIKAMKLKLCLVFPSKKKLCLVRFNTCNTERYLCPKSQRVLVLHVGCLFFFCNIVTITTWILQQVFSISLIFYNFR
ncbi:Os12g0540200, partial [Oryza sativa Japonica Group]